MFNYIRYEKTINYIISEEPQFLFKESDLPNKQESYLVLHPTPVKGRQTTSNHILQTYYITAANYQFDALRASCSSIHH